ncbi:MAG: hypothetical protein R2725_07725 [Solirubrobacterales bacterium]
MHYCERCGSTYRATVAESARNCPKCSDEGVTVPLRFRIFEPSALRVAGIAPQKAGRPPETPSSSG